MNTTCEIRRPYQIICAGETCNVTPLNEAGALFVGSITLQSADALRQLAQSLIAVADMIQKERHNE